MKLSQENKKSIKSLGLNPDNPSDVQKWLRDYFEIDIEILRSSSMLKSYYYKIIVNNDQSRIEIQDLSNSRTYEEAQIDAIERALEIKNTYILCSSLILDHEPGNIKDLVLGDFIKNCEKLMDEVNKDSLYSLFTYSWYKSLCMNLVDVHDLVKLESFKYTDFKGKVNRKLLELHGRGNYEYLFGAGEFPFILGTVYRSRDNKIIITYKPGR